jgi:hypothetical protein
MSDRDAEHTLTELQEARAEIDRLRELIRWRKWPEEKPVTSGRYLVLTDGSTDIGNHLSYWSRTAESWSTKDAGIAHWRPIGPLPGINDAKPN